MGSTELDLHATYDTASSKMRVDVTANLKRYCTDCTVPRNLKGGIGSLFDPPVNAMVRRPYWSSRVEVSYCTFGFGAIIQRNLRTLSLPHDSPPKTYMRV